MAAAAVWPKVLGSVFRRLQTTLVFAHIGKPGRAYSSYYRVIRRHGTGREATVV